MRNALLLSLACSTVAHAQSRDLRVAVTFDDIPSVAVAQCNATALNQRLLAKLKQHSTPATALVVTGPGRCGAHQLPGILAAWRAGGHEIGSHTHSHRDINTLTLPVYLRDVDTAHARLTAMQPRGTPVRYFRHPFLHAGNTAAKKEGLDR